MEELIGETLNELPFTLIKRGDLYYYEGPILSHFSDENEQDYFMNWADMDNLYGRWLLTEVSKENVGKYLSRNISLYELIISNDAGKVYFIDIDNDIEYRHIWRVAVENIPNDYLPAKDSYFERLYADDYSDELISVCNN